MNKEAKDVQKFKEFFKNRISDNYNYVLGQDIFQYKSLMSYLDDNKKLKNKM